MAEAGEVFKGGLPGAWEVPYSLGTPVAVLLETGEESEEVRRVLERAGFVGVEVGEGDVKMLREVARAVMDRAAVLTAVSVWTLWRMQRERLEEKGEAGVAYTGSVLEKHEGVRKRCQEVYTDLQKKASKSLLGFCESLGGMWGWQGAGIWWLLWRGGEGGFK